MTNEVTAQQFKQFKYIAVAAFIFMLAHTVEEALARIWTVDPFMISASQYLKIGPAWVYAFIQIVALTIILAFLLQISVQKYNWWLAIVLGILFIGELSHPVVSIFTYYPGLYTGTALAIVGLFYWKELMLLLRGKTK